jgi:hypothetical protein
MRVILNYILIHIILHYICGGDFLQINPIYYHLTHSGNGGSYLGEALVLILVSFESYLRVHDLPQHLKKRNYYLLLLFRENIITIERNSFFFVN